MAQALFGLRLLRRPCRRMPRYIGVNAFTFHESLEKGLNSCFLDLAILRGTVYKFV